MRTEGRFWFKCKECGDKLPMGMGDISCHSAFDLTYTINVVPCKKCIKKITEPAMRLRKAIEDMGVGDE